MRPITNRGVSAAARLGAAVAVVAMIAGVGSTPRASAELDGSSAWSATARADAMAIEYLNTAAPVFAEEPVIYGTPASAQSLVDSVGQSNAFAAAPYPGDIMVGLADNGNGAATGAGAPGIFPTYPFYVSTEYPIREDAVQDQSGNRLVAHSEEHASSSSARSGLITGDMLAALQAQASSSAAVDSATGQLTATADSRLDAFKLTDSLQIGKSTAHAKVVRAPGAELVKESSFTIGSIIVGEVEMSYGDEGFKLADESAAPPGDPTPLFEALEQAGITIEILPATGTDTSVESAGMKITQVQDFGAGKQRISFILGRVSARIEGEATAVDDPLFDGFPTAGPTEADPVFADAPSPEAGLEAQDPLLADELVATDVGFDLGAVSGDLPDLALPLPEEDAAALPPAVEAVSPGARTSVAAPAPDVRLVSPASVGRGLRDDDVAGFYLAVGGIGALMTLGAFLLRGRARGAAAASVLKLPNG